MTRSFLNEPVTQKHRTCRLKHPGDKWVTRACHRKSSYRASKMPKVTKVTSFSKVGFPRSLCPPEVEDLSHHLLGLRLELAVTPDEPWAVGVVAPPHPLPAAHIAGAPHHAAANHVVDTPDAALHGLFVGPPSFARPVHSAYGLAV